jgi:ABC-2 type transport system permease protein
MKALSALLRKQLIEARWLLGLMAAGLMLVGFLWSWGVAYNEKRLGDETLPSREMRGFGIYRVFGGPAMDFSSLAMASSCWNHPVIILTIMGWTLARGSAAVAHEVERGTLDLTLSRPVSRSVYLFSHLLFDICGLAVLAIAIVAGTLIADQVFHLKTHLSVLRLMRPAAMLVALGISIYGYTLPFSAADVVRWRSAVTGMAITLGGLVAMMLARQFSGYDWLEKLSVFQAYAPVTVAMKGDPLAFNASVLTAIFILGAVVSLAIFNQRDLPTNA